MTKDQILRAVGRYKGTAILAQYHYEYGNVLDGFHASQVAAVFALMWVVTPDPGEEQTVLEIPFSSYQRYANVRDGHFYGHAETFVIPPGKYKLVKVSE